MLAVLIVQQALRQLLKLELVGGTYTAPAGVVINAAAGIINLATSKPATYTITYSFTVGACSNTATTSNNNYCASNSYNNYMLHRHTVQPELRSYSNWYWWRNIYCSCWGCHKCSNRRYQPCNKYPRNIHYYLQFHCRGM